LDKSQGFCDILVTLMHCLNKALMQPVILDTTAPFEFFSKNGYYSVGNAIATLQGTALQEATRTGLPVKWHFNEQAYNQLNWRTRWNLPITEVYRMRAQQLRDKYDYLMLWFSGGADSTVILESFVHNNIHLDEVVCAWPLSQTQGKYTPNNIDTSASNMPSEWDLSIKPKLDRLAKNHPRVKITVLDFMARVPTVEDFEDTWTVMEKHTYVAIQRQRALDQVVIDRVEKHHNVAAIAGISPPSLSVMNDRYLIAHFPSHLVSAGLGKSDYIKDGVPRNVEFFYWTPDMPEIVREQAHIVLDSLNSNPAAKALFYPYDLYSRKMPDLTYEEKELQRRFIKASIYPSWDHTTFQTFKPTDILTYCEQYNWFYKNPESQKYIESWKSAIASQHRLIDPRFLKRNQAGVVYNFTDSFFSKFYAIGKIDS
jgi:hypothetical protein